MYYLVESEEKSMKSFYSLIEQIGEGTFSKVWRATEKLTGEAVAIKTFNKSTLAHIENDSLYQLINLVSQVDHPNIIRTYKYFNEPKSLHVVMELVAGGELLDKIIEKDHYSEQETANALRPVIDALKHCHDVGIFLGDLKPENLLCSSHDIDCIVKVGIFSLARLCDEEIFSTGWSFSDYRAPEILIGRGYGLEADCWSIGVILYTMLSGFLPFNEDTIGAQYEAIKAGNFRFPEEYWNGISDMAKDLIVQCLKVNPKERITAKDMLEHPWIGENCTPEIYASGQL